MMTTDREPDPRPQPDAEEARVEAGRKGGAVAAALPRRAPWTGAVARPVPDVRYAGRVITRWSAIWAGLFAGAMIYLLFTVLGIAIGFTISGPAGVATLQTASLAWLLATA